MMDELVVSLTAKQVADILKELGDHIIDSNIIQNVKYPHLANLWHILNLSGYEMALEDEEGTPPFPFKCEIVTYDYSEYDGDGGGGKVIPLKRTAA